MPDMCPGTGGNAKGGDWYTTGLGVDAEGDPCVLISGYCPVCGEFVPGFSYVLWPEGVRYRIAPHPAKEHADA